MVRGFTRRSVLSAILLSSLLGAEKLSKKSARSLPQAGEFTRLVDPLTENIVVRLTYPNFDSFFPSSLNRFISAKERFLVYSSNRNGRLAPFQVDLHTGRSRQLAATGKLVHSSLCLDEREKLLYFLDGTTLKEVALSNARQRTIAENVSRFALEPNSSQIIVLRHGCLEHLTGNRTIAENVNEQAIAVHPSGAGCFFGRTASDASERNFWYASFAAGEKTKPRLLAQGNIWNPVWSPDGRSFLFLRAVDQHSVATSEIREVSLETGVEQRVVRTNQFAAFAPNADGSVFVGASRSRAQPSIDILLRSVGRGLTLCEHRATDSMNASPVFSPDSRRIYFGGDREGKPTLYAVNVERIIEPTG